MKKLSIKQYEIISTIFILIIGTLLHFTYKWSNNNTIVGIYSATNESTWEHLKLVFYPMLITTIIGNILYKYKIPNYLCIKTKGIIISILFIIISFYTYSGIIGTNYGIINILLFIIFTFYPPNINLFLDPVTNTYGI